MVDTTGCDELGHTPKLRYGLQRFFASYEDLPEHIKQRIPFFGNMVRWGGGVWIWRCGDHVCTRCKKRI